MGVTKPSHGRRKPDIKHHDGKKLRSGRIVRTWTAAQNGTRIEQKRKYRNKREAPHRQMSFPFLKLPVELRLMIYELLLRAAHRKSTRRALPQHPQQTADSSIGEGKVVAGRLSGVIGSLHPGSAKPALKILAICHQIRLEAADVMYKQNAFEVIARTQHSSGQPIFGLPGFLRLDMVRHLILITHSEVSRYQSCFAYEIFTYLRELRKLTIAMKSILISDRPDFHSCLEALNLVLWIPTHVAVEFANGSQLSHHDHPSWVSPLVLAMYFNQFDELRGAGSGRWTADISIAYDKGLQIAKGFSLM